MQMGGEMANLAAQVCEDLAVNGREAGVADSYGALKVLESVH